MNGLVRRMRKGRIPSALQEWTSIAAMFILTATFVVLVFALTDRDTGTLLRVAAIDLRGGFLGNSLCFPADLQTALCLLCGPDLHKSGQPDPERRRTGLQAGGRNPCLKGTDEAEPVI